MKGILLLLSLVGALVADWTSEWKPRLREVRLKRTLSSSAEQLTRYFRGASFDDWFDFAQGLTPTAKIKLSLLGHEFCLEGQAMVAKVLREQRALLSGLQVETSNAIVESEAGRLAAVLIQGIITDDRRNISEAVMLRLGLIRVEGRWLIHQVQTVEGYMPLI